LSFASARLVLVMAALRLWRTWWGGQHLDKFNLTFGQIRFDRRDEWNLHDTWVVVGGLLDGLPASAHEGLGHLCADGEVPHDGGGEGDGRSAGRASAGRAAGGPARRHGHAVRGLVRRGGVRLLHRQVAVVAGAVEALGVGAGAGEVLLGRDWSGPAITTRHSTLLTQFLRVSGMRPTMARRTSLAAISRSSIAAASLQGDG
jgi:hypothetical protein